MAKQIGLIKLSGTLDNLTFYQMDGEDYARTKSSLDAQRIANDPAFARTRENANEFKTAAKASNLIKRSLLPILIPKNYFNARLNSIGTKALRQDTVNVRGQRTIQDGNFNEYYGFEGVANNQGIDFFDGTVNVNFNTVGFLDIQILPFVPFTDLSYPGGATHVRFDFAYALLNLVDGNFVSAQQIGNYVLVSQNSLTPVVNYSLFLNLATADYASACMTLKFYQFLNGVYYELSENRASALILTYAY